MVTLQPYCNKSPQIHSSVFLADGVRIIGDVKIERNCSVWFNSVLRGDINSIYIGEGTNIQDLSMLHVTQDKYPVQIGSYNTIGHGAILHGCKIGNYSLIGMGSIILDGATIGNNVIIAAGTVVLEKFEVPDNVLIAGVPGTIKRQLTEDEKQSIIQSSQHYIDYASAIRQGKGV
ncbi:MAG TPA: gamma carbonic anhydrase family protein [Bacteroidota bacterium]|jgi:carbonic anhydrase/acetyltransferase-like protein (isoleucine patch superfamily)|nr:gamma carbonic anhydrase family protein [Bacteroidota bacterium]